MKKESDRRFTIGLIIIIIGAVWLAISAFTLKSDGTVHYILSLLCIIAGLIVMHTEGKRPQTATRQRPSQLSSEADEAQSLPTDAAEGYERKRRKKKTVWAIVAAALVVVCAGGIWLAVGMNGRTSAAEIEEYNNTLYRYYAAQLILVDSENLENFEAMCNVADSYDLALSSIPEDARGPMIENLETLLDAGATMINELEAPPKECQQGYEIAQKIYEAFEDQFLTMKQAYENAARGEAMTYYDRASEANAKHSDAVEELGKWLDEMGFEPPEPAQTSVPANSSTPEQESIVPVIAPTIAPSANGTEEVKQTVTPEPTSTPIQTKEPEKTEKPTGNQETETTSQLDAVDRAEDYLAYTAFSRQGLIEQLEYEGFSKEDATYGADNSGADWMKQAEEKAQDYLDYTSFSREGLIEQLEYEGFTNKEAVHGVDSTGADWMKQAEQKAQDYLDFSSFSRKELISQLEYEGFTHEQAVHGVNIAGVD